MYCKLILYLLVLLFSAVTATAQEMSIVNESESKEIATAAWEITNDKQAETKDVTAAAQEMNKHKEPEAKELSGISIVGNDEAPKSLYIVPWKSSEIGAETGLDTMLSEGDVPVDRDVFMRQLNFFEVSTKK